MAAKKFDFAPIPQPAAPARDRALAASSDGSLPLAAARLVPVDRLAADPDQPRKVFDEEALQDLALSLRTAGMRQPITAYYDDSQERFVVVSGERRLLAARLAGLTEVPVLVDHRPTSDADKLVLQLAENLVREDLTVPDAARALGRLKQLRPADWLEVARRHGIGRRRAYQYLEHLTDPEPLQEALRGAIISEGHAEELRRAPAEDLTMLLTDVVEQKLSVADTRRLLAARRAEAADRSRDDFQATRPAPNTVRFAPDRSQVAPDHTLSADQVAGVMQSEQQSPGIRSAAEALRLRKVRRERGRRLRQRLARIAAELRNAHVEELAGELEDLPEILMQAREARAGLERLIDLLERVGLDAAGPREKTL
jgi:ParB family chromosome partitioning protein